MYIQFMFLQAGLSIYKHIEGRVLARSWNWLPNHCGLSRGHDSGGQIMITEVIGMITEFIGMVGRSKYL